MHKKYEGVRMTVLNLYEKDYEKINKQSKLLFNARLIITCFACLIALTLYLLNLLYLPVLCLILLGAIWNFFVDINTFIAFLLSVVVGMLFAMLSIIEGLYANALLYVLFYIPLQFVVWINNPKEFDSTIKIDKKLSKTVVYYICLAFLSAFSIVSTLIINLEQEMLIFFDVFSACLLGLSAFLQSYRYREYYSVRILAVIISIVLWISVLHIVYFSMIAVGMIILYSMYLLADVVTLISYIRSRVPYDKEAVEQLDEKSKKKLVREKIKEYNEQLLETRMYSADDKGING